MIPRATTLAVVEGGELDAAQEWARRGRADLTWYADSLEVRVVLTQRATGHRFFLLGKLDGYKAVPPAWDFRDPSWGSPRTQRNYPARAQLPGGCTSIFHPSPVICAHFNRLAYSSDGGPHNNWGGPAQWLNVREGVRADTIADMLAAIFRDLNYSSGRMG